MNIKRFTKQLFPLFIILLLIVACSSDDTGEAIVDHDSQTTLEEERDETTTILTNNVEKTWKISNAILTNESGAFDISENFNIVDDEFILSSEGSIEWRQGNAINSEGATNQETLLDYYRSPIKSSYSFIEESGTELTAINGRFVFEVIDSNTISGILSFEGNSTGELNLTLINKSSDDYILEPSNALNFTEEFIITSNSIQNGAPGLIYSYSDNSLFFVSREYETSIYPERVVKWNLETGNQSEYRYYNDDYISKELQIINNQLVVTGGQFINTYPLDLSTEPISVNHGLEITRFGVGSTENNIYISGGDLDIDGNGNIEAEKIYKWDIENNSLEYFTDMPEDRFGARSTIVDDKLYIFGGTPEFAAQNSIPNNTIYIYDINNGELTTEEMNTKVEYSFVDRYQNMIYMAGYYWDENEDGTAFVKNIIATYNTKTNTYQEYEHNLDNTTDYYLVFNMCIVNNKMFVVYSNNEDGPVDVSIMSANLE